jgi:hypothetical protein
VDLIEIHRQCTNLLTAAEKCQQAASDELEVMSPSLEIIRVGSA